jgi:subfamily B ATP-binding cassette protein MsbA
VFSRPRGLFRLLAPYAKPFVGALALVFVLNGLGALLQQGTYLLLQPTWTLLFADDPADQVDLDLAREVLTEAQAQNPEDAQLAQALEALAPPTAPPAEPDDALDQARGWLNDQLLGDPGELTPERRLQLLGVVAIVISIMAVIAALAQYLAAILSARVGHGMIVALRQDLAGHLMKLSLGFHGRRRFGDLLSRISADVGQTLTVINLFLRDLVQEPLMAITAMGWAFFVAPEATLVVLLGTPLLVIPVGLILKKVKKRSTKSLTKLGASMQVLTQMLQGIRTVKAYRAEDRELARFKQANDQYVHEAVRLAKVTAISSAWTILYTHAGLGMIVVLVGWLAVSGGVQRDPGEMLTFFMLISRSYASIKRTTRALGQVAQSEGAADRLRDLFDEPIDIIEEAGAQTVDGLGGGLVLRDLTFTYPGSDKPALKNFNLTIPAGETLALVGPSGCGKSTLVDLVARFLDPDEGSIEVGDGLDLRKISLDSWTKQYAMVTQVPFLFHTTVGANIRYGREEASQTEVDAAAEAAGIADFVRDLPEGFETNVEDAGARLSGGQCQRITIARAFLRGAPLLLLDEATSALDSESERLVQQALNRLMMNHTVLVVAHRLSTVRRADRIAVLDEGELKELGTHEELLAKGGLYSRLWNLQDGSLGSGDPDKNQDT